MELLGIILVEPKNYRNVGAVARSMMAFGIKKLILIGRFNEIFLKKASKIAKQGKEIIEKYLEIKSSLSEVEGKKIGTISEFDNRKYNFHLVPIWKLNEVKGKYYLVFGRESVGLKEEELKECDIISTIPTNGKYGILNLAMAVTIYLYELTKQNFQKR